MQWLGVRDSLLPIPCSPFPMTWKSLFEWYLGLPATQAGEGTRWTWQWQRPWPTDWPTALAGVVVVGLLASTWWAYRRDAAHLSGPRVGLLWGLRWLAIGLAILLWMQPTLWIAKTGLPPVAVMLDTSASMSIRDGSGSKKPSAELSPDRWDQIAQVLLQRDGRWLKSLAAGRPMRVYQFAGTAIPVSAGDLSTDPDWPQLLETIGTLAPTGAETRPAEAVRHVLGELRGTPPAGLVIFTDGIASEGDQDKLSTIADLVRRRGIPLFVVPVGSDAVGRDVELMDVEIDEIAFKGDPIAIAGRIRTPGISSGKIPVVIQRDGGPAPLTTVEVTPRADGQPVRFETTVTLQEAGEYDFTIEVPLQPEELDKTNNRQRRHVSVREERLKVLLIEGAPRYEFRYLKQWLERDTSVELKTLLADADPEYAEEDRTAIPYFPVKREELDKFDVVILGDVSLVQLGAAAPEWLVSFVRERGGGVILISGPKANPRGWAGSPLEFLLPVPTESLAGLKPPSEATEPYTPQLTIDGKKGVPMFRFAESEAASQEIWTQLPGLYGLWELPKLKPGVRILAEHPFRRGDREKLPVMTLQQIGAGKVLFHANDETWRWRFRTGDAYYGRYWGQAIRYLSRGKLLGQDRTAELLFDRQSYRRGEPVTARVRFLNETQIPERDGVRVVLERAGGGRQEVTLTPLPYAPAVFEGQAGALGEGTYHAWIARPSFDGTPPSAEFRIESVQRELQQRPIDRNDLKIAAERAGGRLVPLSEIDSLPDMIPPGAAVPLEYGTSLSVWQRSEPLLLLACLLGAEWLLRRRWKLI